VLMPQEEVTQVREAAAAVAWERAAAFIKEAEARATLAERGARERVLRVEVESAAVLVSACREAEGFTWRIALLEGELEDVH
jgi:hypothetical protein